MYLDAIKYPGLDHRIFADDHSSHLSPGGMVLHHSEGPAMLSWDREQNGRPSCAVPSSCYAPSPRAIGLSGTGCTRVEACYMPKTLQINSITESSMWQFFVEEIGKVKLTILYSGY